MRVNMFGFLAHTIYQPTLCIRQIQCATCEPNYVLLQPQVHALSVCYRPRPRECDCASYRIILVLRVIAHCAKRRRSDKLRHVCFNTRLLQPVKPITSSVSATVPIEIKILGVRRAACTQSGRCGIVQGKAQTAQKMPER